MHQQNMFLAQEIKDELFIVVQVDFFLVKPWKHVERGAWFYKREPRNPGQKLHGHRALFP